MSKPKNSEIAASNNHHEKTCCCVDCCLLVAASNNHNKEECCCVDCCWLRENTKQKVRKTRILSKAKNTTSFPPNLTGGQKNGGNVKYTVKQLLKKMGYEYDGRIDSYVQKKGLKLPKKISAEIIRELFKTKRRKKNSASFDPYAGGYDMNYGVGASWPGDDTSDNC